MCNYYCLLCAKLHKFPHCLGYVEIKFMFNMFVQLECLQFRENIVMPIKVMSGGKCLVELARLVGWLPTCMQICMCLLPCASNKTYHLEGSQQSIVLIVPYNTQVVSPAQITSTINLESFSVEIFIC